MPLPRWLLRMPPSLATSLLACVVGTMAWAACREPSIAPAAPDPVSLDKLPKLSESFPETRFQDVAFEDAIRFMEDSLQIRIHLTADALRYRNQQVNLRARNTPAIEILSAMLKQAAGSDLRFGTDGGDLVIMSHEEASVSAAGVDFWVADAAVPYYWRGKRDGDKHDPDKLYRFVRLLVQSVDRGQDHPPREVLGDPDTMVVHVHHSPIAIDKMKSYLDATGAPKTPPMQKRAGMP